MKINFEPHVTYDNLYNNKIYIDDIPYSFKKTDLTKYIDTFILNYKNKDHKFYYMRQPNTTQRSGFIDFLNDLSKYKNLNILEVGSFIGEGTDLFLKKCDVCNIYCVDIFGNGYTNCIYEKIFDYFHGNNSKVHKIIGKIDKFLEKNISNIDIVYLDSDHSYKNVKNEFSIVMNYIKPKIAISGHDYYMCGVRENIKYFLNDNIRKYKDCSWIYFYDT